MEQEVIFLPSLKFPQKLWYIINRCESGAISWSSTGCTILLNYKLFQEEYLSSDDKIFKTNNITSFIRQLNMYGFRKVASHKNDISNSQTENVHEFVHENFQCGRADLLEKVCRKTGTRCHRSENMSESIKIDSKRQECDEILQLPMTRLQACKLGLQEALHQAIIRYEALKTRETLEEAEDCRYEEFKFYYVYDTFSLNETLETITIFVPKITEKNNDDWYSEALLTIMNNIFNV